MCGLAVRVGAGLEERGFRLSALPVLSSHRCGFPRKVKLLEKCSSDGASDFEVAGEGREGRGACGEGEGGRRRESAVRLGDCETLSCSISSAVRGTALMFLSHPQTPPASVPCRLVL